MIELTGVILSVGQSPVSDRIYPKDVVEKAVKDFNARYSDKGIECLGQCGSNIGMEVSINSVSHIVTKCELTEDGHVISTIKTLETPKGKLIESIIENSNAGNTNLQLLPVMTGTIKDNNIVENLVLHRVDLTFI